MKLEHTLPADIESTSMGIIGTELAQMGVTLPPETEAVVKRVIHTTADFDYVRNLQFTPDAVQKGVELLLCVGEMSKNTCRAAEGIAALHFDNNAQLISQLPQLINEGDTVLVKASHSMKLEEISEALKLLK